MYVLGFLLCLCDVKIEMMLDTYTTYVQQSVAWLDANVCIVFKIFPLLETVTVVVGFFSPELPMKIYKLRSRWSAYCVTLTQPTQSTVA